MRNKSSCTTVRSLVRALVALSGLAICPLLAYASPVTYDFTVTATSGPLAGTTASGDFTFDSSSIVPGGTNAAPGLLTVLDFTWDGITYNASTANTGELDFDVLGNLTGVLFGNNCGVLTCAVAPGAEQWFFQFGVFGFHRFVYSQPGQTGTFDGAVTLTERATVPGTGTLALLALGIAVLGFSLRAPKQLIGRSQQTLP